MKNNVLKGSLCCIGSILNTGFSYLMMNIAGLLTVPLVTKLGCSYADIGLIWSALSLGAMLVRTIQGHLYEKFNPKIVTLLGVFSYVFGLTALAFVTKPIQAIILYFIVGLGNSFCGSLPVSLLGSKWIGIGRGSIVGLAGAAGGIITVVVAPIAAKMVGLYDFETVAIASGVILAVLHAIVTLLFICRPPEAYGMEPIDLHFLEAKNKKATEATAVYETKMPIKELMKLPIFWILLFLPALICIAQTGFYSNRSGIWTEMGMSLEQIGTLGGVFTFANAIFVWTFGILCDKLGFRKVVLGFAVFGIVIYALFPVYAGMGYVAAFLMAIFFNVGQINGYIGPNAMLPLFGRNKSNVLISWSMMFAAIGGLLAPVVVKLCGTYNTFFAVGAIIYFVIFVMIFVSTKPSALQKIKVADEKWVAANGEAE